MSFASPWALAGLLLAIPLLLLHLRRPRPQPRKVGSLLAWRDTPAAVGPSSRRLGRPASSWLLFLQLLALVLLVLALARPQVDRDGGSVPTTRAFVVDDSIWMQTRQDGRTRLESAAATLRADLEALPRGRRVSIFLAGPETKLLYEGRAGDAGDAVRRFPPTFGAADLTAAVRLAATVPGQTGAIELLRAPEDAAPRTTGATGSLRDRVIGSEIADQGVDRGERTLPVGVAALPDLRPGREHGEGPPHRPCRGACRRPADQRAVGAGRGGRIVAGRLRGTGRGAGDARARGWRPAGRRRPRLRRRARGRTGPRHPDRRKGGRRTAGASADRGAGDEGHAADPGRFPPRRRRAAGLVVVDGEEPRRAIPASAAAVIRVDPPRLPGGKVDGPLVHSRLSGTDPTAAALEGVDLGSLTIGRGGARRLVLPPWLRAVAWAPGGPLLALGTHACRRKRRSPSIPPTPTCPSSRRSRGWSRTSSPGARNGRPPRSPRGSRSLPSGRRGRGRRRSSTRPAAA